jgi:hypothetical protein
MNFVTRKHVRRRTFLKGLGAAIGLPLLDAMTPAFAEPSKDPARHPPCRMAFVYVPNGIQMAYWTPVTEGREFDLPRILAPLAPYRDQLTVLSGLAQNGARPLGDGPGDHARAAASFLTGVHPRKTAGEGILNGPSVDQIAAEQLKDATPFASLELGCEPGGSAGDCDSGYSCAYSNNLAWRTATSPLPPETNPRLLFERLFSGFDASGDPAVRSRRARYDQSILDFVSEDARRLSASLGLSDRKKLDEYLYAVRDIERRIAVVAEKTKDLPAFDHPSGDYQAGIPEDFAQHSRLMFDLLAVAFQADLTRVATFMLAREGSGRAYPEIGIAEAHHPLTHHDNDAGKIEKVAQINCYHLEQFAYFVGRLRAMEEGGGTLLGHSMALYGSGISDGNGHDHGDLPVLLAGGGNGRLSAGWHRRYAKETPMANLYLTMLNVIQLPLDHLGDATGPLDL